jgi:hypothetical protein
VHAGDSLFEPAFVGSYFYSQLKGSQLQTKSNKKLYSVTLEFANGSTKVVKIKAVDQNAANKRARKFNPSAIGVKNA